jgi:hypothetical protein
MQADRTGDGKGENATRVRTRSSSTKWAVGEDVAPSLAMGATPIPLCVCFPFSLSRKKLLISKNDWHIYGIPKKTFQTQQRNSED